MPENQRRVHERMDPYRVEWRESRDSEAHPESRAVAVLFDVTGSMGRVPRILQQNLCQLMNLLLAKGYLAHPQILIGGIGDATCDRTRCRSASSSPASKSTKTWPNSGWKGAAADKDRVVRAGHVLHGPQDGDRLPGETPPAGIPVPDRRRDAIPLRQPEAGGNLLGERLEADIPVEDVIRELETQYDTYFILPNLTSYYDDPQILRCWKRLLGEKVIRLDDPQGISDLIAAVIGMKEGADLDRIVADLHEAGRGGMARVVAQALASMGHGEAPSRQTMPATVGMDGRDLPARFGTKPHWDFGFTYKSRRWHFVMRVIRPLTRPAG